jgi:hypothetical protein
VHQALSLLQRAEELGNVSKACEVMMSEIVPSVEVIESLPTAA